MTQAVESIGSVGALSEGRYTPRSFYLDLFVRLFTQKPLGALGFVLILVLLGTAAIATLTPNVIPYGYNERNVSIRLEGPSRAHVFGTDKYGRDVFSRVLHGARVSVAVGFGATALSLSFATLLGLVSGYAGGWFDTLFQRLVDTVMSVPAIILLLIIVTYAPPGLLTVIFALGFVGSFRGSRIIRGNTIALRDHTFVEAARVSGARPLRTMIAHILPNLFPIMIVMATVEIGGAILAEASLSFLGFGIPPPLPSWGSMVSDRQFMLQDPWISLGPGIALFLTVFAWNVFGDAMRDLLDPYLHGSRQLSLAATSTPTADQPNQLLGIIRTRPPREPAQLHAPPTIEVKGNSAQGEQPHHRMSEAAVRPRSEVSQEDMAAHRS